MIIESLELKDFRNIEDVTIHFSNGTNIFYGDNAQGKTNLLEALFMVSTTKSHRGTKDKDIINFEKEEGHIRTVIIKNEIDYRVDIHLKKSRAKGIAINGQKLKKASQLLGLLNIIFFSPEDLDIVKRGPAGRRRFLDIELCQIEENYLYDLNHYNKIIEQRNKLLRDISKNPSMEVTLDLWDEQLLQYGLKIIERREKFIHEINEMIGDIHLKLTGEKEKLNLKYEPNVTTEEFKNKIKERRKTDIFQHMTTVGPHRDDFGFFLQGEKEIDFRKFGSQGQQRTCALSLKLAEIEIVKRKTGESPVLMLDDVLSELDATRRQFLLDSIGSLQTFITCTGLDEFINERFLIDQVFYVNNGKVYPDKNAIMDSFI